MKESTKRVIRTSLAVLVSLAAMAPVLVAQAGLDAGQWPWLATILAVAAGITRVMALPQVNDLLVKFGIGMPDGRHELGRTGDSTDGSGSDSGRVVVQVLVLLAASAVIAVLTAGPALAHRRPPTPNRPVLAAVLHLQVRSAWACDEVLLVSYDTEQLVGKAWTLRLDDGRVDVQGFYIGRAAAGPAGTWTALGSVPGGESWRRWPATGVGMPSQVRVVRTDTGVTSVAVPVVAGCPA